MRENTIATIAIQLGDKLKVTATNISVTICIHNGRKLAKPFCTARPAEEHVIVFTWCNATNEYEFDDATFYWSQNVA